MIYLPSKELVDREREMRKEMVYFFNPVLKYLFYTCNPQGFAQYGFNSCRQTAIFGVGYMQEKFPEYAYKVFEGKFHDKIDGVPVDYEHAFIIAQWPASKIAQCRSVLIDLSRTNRPLKFQFISDWNNIYDRGPHYEHCLLASTHELDVDKMLHMPDPEFLTKMPPQQTMELLNMLIQELHALPEDKHKEFYRTIYSTFTNLQEREVSTQ